VDIFQNEACPDVSADLKQFFDRAPLHIRSCLPSSLFSEPAAAYFASGLPVSEVLLPSLVAAPVEIQQPQSVQPVCQTNLPQLPNGELGAAKFTTALSRLEQNHLCPLKYEQVLLADSVDELRKLLVEKYGTILNPKESDRRSKDKKTLSIIVTCGVFAPHLEDVTVQDSEPLQWSCPWRGLIKIAEDGSAAFLAPVYLAGHFERFMALSSLDSEPASGRLEFNDPVNGKKFFVTKCGHAHYSTGPSRGKFAPLLDSRARAAIERAVNGFEEAIEMLENDPDLVNFSERIPEAVRKHRVVHADPILPKRTVENICKCLKTLYGSSYPLSIGKFPDADNRMAIFIRRRGEEVFAYVCTRSSAKLALESGCIHIDATFNMIKGSRDSKDRVLTVSTQDAARKIFLVGTMVAENENLESYQVLFELMIESWKQIDPELLTFKVRRFVFDGFHGLRELIRQVFGFASGIIIRASCFYHSIVSVHRHTKGKIAPGNDGLPALVLHLMHLMAAGPSPAAVLALWNYLKTVITQLPEQIISSNQRDALFEYMDNWYLDPESELFFWQACADVRRITPRGPVFSRSNNVSESGHSSLKRKQKSVPDSELDSREKVTVWLGRRIEKVEFEKFKHELDYLSVEEYRELAQIKHLRISKSLEACGLPWPSRNSRTYLFCRETKLLFGISDEAAARSLIGHFVEEKESPHYRQPFVIREQAGRIDGALLSKVMKRMKIIQFHPDHLPGSKDSFTYATCTCEVNTADAICDDVMAIHYHFVRDWFGTSPGSPGGAPHDYWQVEENKWALEKDVFKFYRIHDDEVATGEGPEVEDARDYWSSSADRQLPLKLMAKFKTLCKNKVGKASAWMRFREGAVQETKAIVGLVQGVIIPWPKSKPKRANESQNSIPKKRTRKDEKAFEGRLAINALEEVRDEHNTNE
jgi:hypothetical protein